MTATGETRPGRPQKTDADGVPTRQRLLRAAVEACVEHGFDGVKLADVARRADVSTPAIYNHFANKDELLVEACRAELYRVLNQQHPRPVDPYQIAAGYLSPTFANARRLQLELHLAALKHPGVAQLLGEWHRDRALEWVEDGVGSLADVKAGYLLLLGLAHLDALSGLRVDEPELAGNVEAMVAALFGKADR